MSRVKTVSISRRRSPCSCLVHSVRYTKALEADRPVLKTLSLVRHVLNVCADVPTTFCSTKKKKKACVVLLAHITFSSSKSCYAHAKKRCSIKSTCIYRSADHSLYYYMSTEYSVSGYSTRLKSNVYSICKRYTYLLMIFEKKKKKKKKKKTRTTGIQPYHDSTNIRSLRNQNWANTYARV